MKNRNFVLGLMVISFLFLVCSRSSTRYQAKQDWTHFVRIAGHGLSLKNVDKIIQDAEDTHLFGIEVDNDIPGRYDSFLNPDKKLEAIRVMAKAAHKINNYAFVYIAGLECITANADKSKHSFFKDHPDWVQRDVNGRPAVFGGGTAFWIVKGDEDVWISPYATEWRKTYMERVRQIAATGIDGIYVDIPYWMTHFNGWEDTWASFDDYTIAEFKKRTGLDAKRDLKLGDFSDPNFRKWVDFRINTITEFMKEIDENVKAVNPKCKTIAEIYPGLGEDAVRVGADVYQLYDVVDVIAHEYSYGGWCSAERTPLDYFGNMAGMYTFRTFAGNKPTWMLTYSWDGHKKVDIKNAMHNLFAAQLMAGTNCWDAEGHVMSGSNDIETRTRVFQWIAQHQKVFYDQRKPINPIGLYFSEKTRDYFPDDFTASYFGVMFLLLQSHLEFQVVTPKTLAQFKGPVLILADVKCLGKEEIDALTSFINLGGTLVVTGETGKYNAKLIKQHKNPIQQLLQITNSNVEKISKHGKKFAYFPVCFGKQYNSLLKKDYNKFAVKGEYKNSDFYKALVRFKHLIVDSLSIAQKINLQASPFVSSQITDVDGRPHIFIANFKGLIANRNAKQIPECGAKVSFPSGSYNKIFALPYMGEKIELATQLINNRLTAKLPDIDKGIVVWCE